jgi:hypothetical protein
VLLIDKVQFMDPIRLDAGLAFIVIRQYENLERAARPTARTIQKLPILENAWSAGEITNSNGVADSLVASQVVTDVDLKSISPNLP